MADPLDISTPIDPLVLRRLAGLPPLVPPHLAIGREIPMRPLTAPRVPAEDAGANSAAPVIAPPAMGGLTPRGLDLGPEAIGSALSAGPARPALRPATLTPPDPNDPRYQLHGAKKVGIGLLGGLAGLGGHLDVATSFNPYQRALTAYNRNVEAEKTNLALEDTASQIEERRAQADRAEAAANKPEKGSLLYDKAGAPIGYQDPEGNMMAPNNPNLPADVKQILGSAKPKTPEADQPLGERTTQLNSMLTSRYQVLNPGKSLPAEYTLGANATQKDFDRIDKGLEAIERAQGTKAQQDTANELRRQAADLAKTKANEAEETKDIQPVIGQDANGRDVLVSAGEAKTMGLKNVMKAGETEVGKAQSARHWIPLATAQGDTTRNKDGSFAHPDTMGILPLIEDLNKRGKLGPAAGRWNDFLAGKYGNGDPEFEALRTKMGLSTTLLMNAHVGNRGGSYMMEHFEDLANAKKMNADTLRSGVKTELDYIKGRAMMPAEEKGNAGGGKLDSLVKKYGG